MGDDDAVKNSVVYLWQLYRERTLARLVDEQPVWVFPNPSFCSEYLIRRLLDRLPEPPTPINLDVPGVRELAGFVRENNDVVFTDDE